jgi:hypothetical protein
MSNYFTKLWATMQHALFATDGQGENGLPDPPRTMAPLMANDNGRNTRGGDSGKQRQVSAGPYEEVTAHATKNLQRLDQDNLHRTLASPSFACASWTNGVRVADRSEFLDQLRQRRARQKKSVVILQPHVSQVLYNAVQPSTNSTPPDANALRLMQFETLLHASRGAITGLGADLHLIGSLS